MPIVRAREFGYEGDFAQWEWLHHVDELLINRAHAEQERWGTYGIEWRRRAQALLVAAFGSTGYAREWLESPARQFDLPPPVDTAPSDLRRRAETLLALDIDILQRAHQYVHDMVPAGQVFKMQPLLEIRDDGWRTARVEDQGKEGPTSAQFASRLEGDVARQLQQTGYQWFRDIRLAHGAMPRLVADFAVDVPDHGRVLIEVKGQSRAAAEFVKRLPESIPGVAGVLLAAPADVIGQIEGSRGVALVPFDSVGAYLRSLANARSATPPPAPAQVLPADVMPVRTFVEVGLLIAILVIGLTVALAVTGLLETLWRPLAVGAAIAVSVAAAVGLAVRLPRPAWLVAGLVRMVRSKSIGALSVAVIGGLIATILGGLAVAWITGAWKP
jgi:hypothetical protein